MQLTAQQKYALRVLRDKVQRKLSLAMTSQAYIKGTNADTVRELRRQLEALDIVTA
jgi:hypothetical protein